MAEESLITRLLRRKRFDEGLSSIDSDDSSNAMDPANALPPVAMANPSAGMPPPMQNQAQNQMPPQMPIPMPNQMPTQMASEMPNQQMQPYSQLELLLNKLGLVNIPKAPISIGAPRG